VFIAGKQSPGAKWRGQPPIDGPTNNYLAEILTDMKKVRAVIYDVPRTEPDAMYVGLNDRDPRWHDLYKLKISTGERRLHNFFQSFLGSNG
jgi:hypothetical protein